MNLRLEHQNLRFRISKEELEKLCLGSPLTQKIFLPNQCVLEIDIIVQTQKSILFLTSEKNHITLHVQKNAAENLRQTLPNREGLRTEQKINNKHILELILEVDIHTQKRKRN